MDQPSSQSTSLTSETRRTHATRWLVCFGLFCLLLPVLTTMVGMVQTFYRITGPISAITPDELAGNVDLVATVTPPSILLGVLLLILGLALRQPAR